MPNTLYTLQVFILEGPLSEEFAKANPSIVRTMEIRGEQTLGDLHCAIFKAFDRWEEHMYEFHFGDGPHDYSRGRYSCCGPLDMMSDLSDDEPAGDAAETTIDSLGLSVGQSFGYWFDFGDDWYHQINVLAIGQAKPKAKYPRVISHVGDSPPQYIYEEDEGEEDE